ncbi:MAG TPA: trypsin-like peptidase domain-containing protein [Usitatibacter sp.]|nr:trypsin-like peptidase domain-containing protein [Usitatibacter sp.]
MNSLPFLAGALLLAGGATLSAAAAEPPLRVPGKPVRAVAKAAPAPGLLDAALFPAGSVIHLHLRPMAASAAAWPRQDDEKRTRIGVRRDVESELASRSGAERLEWIAAPGGGLAARIAVTSPGAAGLRLGLDLRSLPEGAQLRFAGSASRQAQAVDGALAMRAAREDGLYWTPVLEGESQTVELWTPDARAAQGARADVVLVSHLDAAPSAAFKSTGAGSAQSCHRDVACASATDPALAQAARAVAKLVYTDNGASYLCSGTLINDGEAATQVPYVYTAAHCMASQAAARTLNTFWFYEAAACGSVAPAPFRQLHEGAELVYVNTDADAAMVRLNQPAPEGAWFAGWDATPLEAGTAVVGLHHPGGDVKKMASGVTHPLTDSPFVATGWTLGSTEGGSSGSGIFTPWNGEYVLRGSLRGGTASCRSSGQLADPANRDLYTRFDQDASGLRKSFPGPRGPVDRVGGIWWNPDEPGWGLSIAQGERRAIFITWYAYDAEGRATWLVIPEPRWSLPTVLDGEVFRASGSRAGAPYDKSKLTVVPVGRASIEFSGPDAATLVLEVDGRRSQAVLRRMEL